MGRWGWTEVRWASHRAFIQGSQVGPDTLIENTSQVVKHSSPSRWQRAEQEKATASVLSSRELVAQNRVYTSQKSLDFLGQLLSTERRGTVSDRGRPGRPWGPGRVAQRRHPGALDRA